MGSLHHSLSRDRQRGFILPEEHSLDAELLSEPTHSHLGGQTFQSNHEKTPHTDRGSDRYERPERYKPSARERICFRVFGKGVRAINERK